MPRTEEILLMTDSSDDGENKSATSECKNTKFEPFELSDSSDIEADSTGPCGQPLTAPLGAPAPSPCRQPRILWPEAGRFNIVQGDPKLAASIPLQQAWRKQEEEHRGGGVVQDPLEVHREGLVEPRWGEEEQKVFVREFKKKKFHEIAKSLPGKTVKNCVKNYYRMKGRIFEKTLRGKLRFMKKRRAEFDVARWKEERGLAREEERGPAREEGGVGS